MSDFVVAGPRFLTNIAYLLQTQNSSSDANVPLRRLQHTDYYLPRVSSRKKISIYPIFRSLRTGVVDENRHGDFFDALMRSQRRRCLTIASQAVVVPLLPAVSVCHHGNDVSRSGFYATFGLDAREHPRFKRLTRLQAGSFPSF